MSLPTTFNEELTYPSEYVFPTTVEEAVQMLAEWNGAARLIAGGTDLMLELGKGNIHPSCFVSTDHIQGLNQITVKDDFIEIGAAVTFADLKNHPYISQHVHILADAARSVGTLSIQNVATLAGNIVNAMPAADGVVAAIALEAEAQVVEAEGSKWTPVEIAVPRPWLIHRRSDPPVAHPHSLPALRATQGNGLVPHWTPSLADPADPELCGQFIS